MTCEIDTKKPPMTWYTGIAFTGEGVRGVYVGTRTFYTLHRDLYQQMLNWDLTQLVCGRTEFASLAVAQTHREAKIFIKHVTGFTPNKLIEYKKKLEEIYEGQSMGPFPFDVTWITK